MGVEVDVSSRTWVRILGNRGSQVLALPSRAEAAADEPSVPDDALMVAYNVKFCGTREFDLNAQLMRRCAHACDMIEDLRLRTRRPD